MIKTDSAIIVSLLNVTENRNLPPTGQQKAGLHQKFGLCKILYRYSAFIFYYCNQIVGFNNIIMATKQLFHLISSRVISWECSWKCFSSTSSFRCMAANKKTNLQKIPWHIFHQYRWRFSSYHDMIFFLPPHIAKLSTTFWINHFRSAHMFFNTGSTHGPLASIMCLWRKIQLFCERFSTHGFGKKNNECPSVLNSLTVKNNSECMHKRVSVYCMKTKKAMSTVEKQSRVQDSGFLLHIDTIQTCALCRAL